MSRLMLVFAVVATAFAATAQAAAVNVGATWVFVTKNVNGVETPFKNVNVSVELRADRPAFCHSDPGDHPIGSRIPVPCWEQYTVTQYVGKTDENGTFRFPGFSAERLKRPVFIIAADFLDMSNEPMCRVSPGYADPYPRPAPSASKDIHPQDSRYFWVEGGKEISKFPAEVKFVCPQ